MADPSSSTPGDRDAAVGHLCWIFANARLDERRLELSVDGEPVALEKKALQVLQCLLRHAGEVVTKAELFDAVWPGRVVTESALTKTLSQIRAALGDRDQQVIRTAHGFGYRLDAPVEIERADESALVALGIEPGDTPPLRPHWQLVNRLGRGGHGEAWLARHTKTGECRVYKFALNDGSLGSLKREITLHRILRSDAEAATRFVAVLDWNLEEAPYFVEQEYIAGGNLIEWAASCGGLVNMALAARLELLAGLADGLAVAHSLGVLHKDLKPANVLIADSPSGVQVRLCDFGSGGVLDARMLEQLAITRLGFTAGAGGQETGGSLRYQAPELLSGAPASVQADIYALGVILYQLCVGDLNRALAPGWEADIDDELLREDIAQAAAGKPERRLADAAQLAARLRSLDARRAERQAARAAAQKLARAQSLRRDLKRFQLTALVMLVLVIATGLAALSAQRARLRAEAAQAQLEQAVARSRAVSDFMNNELLGGIRRGPQPDSVDFGTVLDRAAARIDERLVDFPAAAAEVHVLFSHRYVYRRSRALEHLSKAATLYEQTQGSAGVETLSTRLTQAEYQLHSGRFEDARSSYDQVLPELRTHLGAKHCVTQHTEIVRAWVHAQIAGPVAQIARLEQLGEAMADCRPPIAADRPLLRALIYVDDLDGAKTHLRAHARSYVVWLLGQLRADLPAAEAHAREVYNALRGLHGEDALPLYFPSRQLARVLSLRGKFDEAEALLDSSDEIVESRMDPGSFWRVFVDQDRGLLRLAQGQFAAAVELLSTALDGCPDFENCSAVEVMAGREALARALAETGEPERASQQARIALSLRRAVHGADHLLNLTAHLALAHAELGAGNAAASRELLNDVSVSQLEGLPVDSRLLVELNQLRSAAGL